MIAKPVGLIEFRELVLTVVKHKNIDYVPLKPISDLLGFNWDVIKTNIFDEQFVDFYGAVRLQPSSQPLSSNYLIHIDLERVPFFLMLAGNSDASNCSLSHSKVDVIHMLGEWVETFAKFILKKPQENNNDC